MNKHSLPYLRATKYTIWFFSAIFCYKVLFEETSSVYANRVESLVNSKSIIKGNIGFVKTERNESIDINDKTDIIILNSLIQNNKLSI